MCMCAYKTVCMCMCVRVCACACDVWYGVCECVCACDICTQTQHSLKLLQLTPSMLKCDADQHSVTHKAQKPLW